ISSGSPATAGGFPAGGWQGGQSPGVQQSSAPGGQLTFQFLSDFSVTLAGWSAVITEAVQPCMITAPANLSASTGLTTCLADVTTPLPTFNPTGCGANNTLRYSVDGGPVNIVPQPLPPSITITGLTSGVHTITWSVVDPTGFVTSTATQ